MLLIITKIFITNVGLGDSKFFNVQMKIRHYIHDHWWYHNSENSVTFKE